MRETPKPIRVICSIFKYAYMIFFVAIAIGPLIWAFLSSFKTYAEINSSAISLPKSITFKNYASAFQYAPIAKYFFNSVMIVGCSVLVTVMFVAM